MRWAKLGVSAKYSFFLEDLYGRYYLKRVGVNEENIEVDVKEMFFEGVDLIQVIGVQDKTKFCKNSMEPSGFTTRQIIDHLNYRVACS
jgi:hypothetical protein